MGSSSHSRESVHIRRMAGRGASQSRRAVNWRGAVCEHGDLHSLVFARARNVQTISTRHIDNESAAIVMGPRANPFSSFELEQILDHQRPSKYKPRTTGRSDEQHAKEEEDTGYVLGE
ncbi:hypothetical protein MMC13_006161 [Lambiella insularis]|nr:hypothetical protein [Lambiella insularis]